MVHLNIFRIDNPSNIISIETSFVVIEGNLMCIGVKKSELLSPLLAFFKPNIGRVKSFKTMKEIYISNVNEYSIYYK